MITKRTLETWRGQTLAFQETINKEKETYIVMGKTTMKSLCDRILRMSQELLDQHLITTRRKS
jgi:hypothetical protein